MVPVANRPVMEHILRLLPRHGFERAIANLHWFPELIRDRFADGSALGIELTYSYEEELLGTAGGVRNVAEYFGSEPFLVMAGDALTDIDLAALRAAHDANGGIATLAVKRVPNVSEFGVVIADSDGRIQGFQEKPDPAEALSDLASCMIYMLSPEIFDYFPDQPAVDFALDVFPGAAGPRRALPRPRDRRLLERRRDRSPSTCRATSTRFRAGSTVELEGELLEPSGGEDALEAGEPGVSGRVLGRRGCRIDPTARLDGPLVIGRESSVGSGACVKESVVLPGADVPEGALVAGAVYGRRA